MLLAAGVENWLVPILVLSFYAVASMLKMAAEKKPQPQRRPAAPVRPAPRPIPERMELGEDPTAMRPRPVPEKVTPQQDLERMLDELGIRRPAQAPQRSLPPPPPRPSRKERRQRQQVNQSEQRKTVKQPQRTLHSSLETRHGEQIHSNIEQSAQATLRSQGYLDSLAAASPEVILRETMTRKELFTQSTILGMIMGPPLALRERRPIL